LTFAGCVEECGDDAEDGMVRGLGELPHQPLPPPKEVEGDED